MWRLLVLGLFSFIALPARAEGPAAAHPERNAVAPRPTEPCDCADALDYRWQLVLSDLAAVTTVVAGAATDNDGSVPLVATGIGMYALVPAVVHLAHDQPGRAAISAGIRIGLPAIGVGLGVALAAGCDGPHVDEYGETESDLCPVGAVIFGGLVASIGALTAAIIDDSTLGKVPAEQQPPRATWGVAPLVSPRRSAVGMSVVGAF